MSVANSLGRQNIVIDQPHDGRAAHAEKVGRLLCGQRAGRSVTEIERAYPPACTPGGATQFSWGASTNSLMG
jgi:hypothetical protein